MANPKKTAAAALYGAIALIVIYVLVSIGVIATRHSRAARRQGLRPAEAAKPFLGQAGFTLIAIAALFSTSSAVNATLFVQQT